MKLFSLPVAAAALASAPAQAREPDWNEIRKLEIIYQSLSVVDAAQTIHCLNQRTCDETNPLYGRNPAPELLIGAKISIGAAHFLATRWLFKESPNAARLFQHLSIGIQGAAVGANMRFVF